MASFRAQYLIFSLVLLSISLYSTTISAQDEGLNEDVIIDEDIGDSRDASRTDDEVVAREEEAIKLDGLNVAQMKMIREESEHHVFQAEVNKMMTLIINSLYKNKEIFLRELISNASDALDKIRFLALTDTNSLSATEEMSIKIKADKENNMLHITDTGIGMTKEELINNLGTIAKSGTGDFLEKIREGAASDSDLIGQFGVGFYSTFLVADRVVVTSKHNDEVQYIWESDANEFFISDDPRGNSLLRGTTVSLHMKEESKSYLEDKTLTDLVKKYSQFINFNIYLWTSKTEMVEEEPEEETTGEDAIVDEDEEAMVEEESEEEAGPKMVERTVWDWVLMNENKPLWTRSPKEITDEEYNDFYKSFAKETDDPMGKIHFTAEGEVTFKALLYIPKTAPTGALSNTPEMNNIKLHVKRVFITDDFEELMPVYLNFIKGVVDSDDLPLNVSRETLQQHKLLKVIRKKLIRKVLDMIKKIEPEEYLHFWKEYGVLMKFGVIEDSPNKSRLAKLLRFFSSNSAEDLTSLVEYVERMKESQKHIYFMAGPNREEVEASPFVETLLSKGFEILYLVDPVDEYLMQSLPEFEGKNFLNVAKGKLKMGEESDKKKERREAREKDFEDLTEWLKNTALIEQISSAVVTERLTTTPCALVAGLSAWSGNMERLNMANAYRNPDDPTYQYYMTQKKTLEINPRHPLIKELNRRIKSDPDDSTTLDMALVMFETATLRSGFVLQDTVGFANRIEKMLRLGVNIDLSEPIEEEEDLDEIITSEETEEEYIDDDEIIDDFDMQDLEEAEETILRDEL